MSHGCSTLVLHCIDYRFGKAKKRFLEENNLLGDCDIVAVAGAAQTIASPHAPSETDLVFRQIDIAQRLHGISRVVLMNHTDCGAYGGRKAFGSVEEERTHHQAEMEKAKNILNLRYPDLTVDTVLAHIDDVGEITFHE